MRRYDHLGLAEREGLRDLQELVNSTRSLRELMQSDPHRPTYHFVAPEGHAMPFDPNGAIYWKGKYHLGYIYQKLIDGKERHVWGHVVSTDLLHWTIYPDMIDVKRGDIEEGIFSGGAFLSREGIPHVIYFGLGASANLIAYATDDDLRTWKKLKGNPVLQGAEDLRGMECCIPPKGEYSVFDPDAWYDKKSDYYYQISGGMKPGLFKSKDMRKWEYLGNVIGGNDPMRHPFEDLSCPDFFSLGDKYMLLFISHTMGAQYYIGTFSDDKFTPEQHGRMSWPGGTFFAAEQLEDEKGRNIIWGWVRQPDKPPHLRDHGWSGVMSLPRVVSLNPSGELQLNPPDEMKTIRLNEVRERDIVLQPRQEVTLQAKGKSIELKMEIAGGARLSFGVKVFASPDGQEETVIRYEPEQEQLVIDFVKSSISGPISIPVFNSEAYDPSKPLLEQFTKRVSEQRAPLVLQNGETLKLDIFLDRSVIEVFANGRQIVTQIVYPELQSSVAVKVFSEGEVVSIKNIQSWNMAETNAY